MSNVVDRQTFIFSTDFSAATGPQIQIGCNITNDSLIGSFPNDGTVHHAPNDHFRLNNSFQTGNFVLQFQEAGADLVFHYNPTSLDTTSTGTVAVTIEFIKLKNKEVY